MEVIRPNRASMCNGQRARYKTGKDQINIVGNLPTETKVFFTENTSIQAITGRAFLSTIYMYVYAQGADCWVMVYDSGPNMSFTDQANPEIVLRIPSAEQPGTFIYETPDVDADEVVMEDGAIAKTGRYFERGIRIYLSSTGDRLTPINAGIADSMVGGWGYATIDIVRMAVSTGAGMVV